jgi:hypothetical protein
MKKFFRISVFTVIVVFLFGLKLNAQDTVTVQTFTFQDIYKRSGKFLFPNKDQTYRKILMLYTLKCDPQTPWDKYNCGEWDYLTYNLIYTPTGVYDSTQQSIKRYSYGYYQPDTLYYSDQKLQAKLKTTKYSTSLISVSNETDFSVSTGGTQALIQGKVARAQFTLLSKDLRALGMKSGGIQKIQLYSTSVGNTLHNLQIRMQSSSSTISDHFSNANFTTVYFGDYTISKSGWQDIYFIQPFNWMQFQNLNMDISFEQDTTNPIILDVAPSTNGVFANQTENYLNFNSANDFVNCGNIQELSNAQKITFEAWVNVKKWSNWSSIINKGDRIFLGTGDQLGELVCAMRNPDNTYGYAINAIKLGEWNHIAMVYDGSQATNDTKLKLYVNGQEVTLTYSGSIPASSASSDSPVTISSNSSKTSSIFGSIDEVSIWKDALSQSDINDWKDVSLTSSHPKYSSLISYYKFDDTTGYVAKDEQQKYNGQLIGTPRWTTAKANELYHFVQNIGYLPRMIISNGDFTIKVDSTVDVQNYDLEPISILEYSIKDHSPYVSKVTYYNPAGWVYLYDDAGNIVDSVYNKPTGSYINDTLKYYSAPFEIKDVTEIGRFITPYGINLDLGPSGFTWVYDVTDYEPLLHDTVEFSAGNTQELIDVKFLFIKGVPPRTVNKIDEVWGPMQSYLYKDMSDDKVLSKTTINVLPESKQFKLVTRLTGHGQRSDNGNFPHCCEWKDNQHYLYTTDSTLIASWSIWQTNDCATNPVYPQGGTWNGAREGWCPGDVVKDNDFEVTNYVHNNKLDLDYDITKVPQDNLGMGNGNYVSCFQLIEYSDLTHENDAEIYNVIMPSDFDYYSRVNPICTDPIIVIRNNGRNDLTSLDFEFYVSGGFKQTYHWTGTIKSMLSEKIVLPIPSSEFWLGDGSNVFNVHISNPNGKPDDYSANDDFKSNFNMPDLLPYNSKLELKTNLRASDFSYSVKDIQGNIVYSNSSLANSKTYNEVFNMPQGCYTLEVTDANNLGLSYWAYPDQGNGSLRITDENGNSLKVFNPDFGHGIKYSFYLGSYSLVQEPNLDNSIVVYPNPANKTVNINLNGVIQGKFTGEIFDLNGNLIKTTNFDNISSNVFSIPINDLTTGTYLLKLTSNKTKVTRKFIVK